MAITTGGTMNSAKIDHAAMYVNELEAARDFFVRYLGGHSDDGYHNKVSGAVLVIKNL